MRVLKKSTAGFMLLMILAVGLAVMAAGSNKTWAAQFASGSGTLEDPYIVTTAQELNQIRLNLGAHYVLANDIDLSADYPVWQPIGTSASANRFTGTIDGQGHTIRGLTIVPINYAGFIASLGAGGKISDVHFEDVNVSGLNAVGSVVGISRGVVERVTVTGTIYGTGLHVGGLAGQLTTADSQIRDSAFEGRVEGINNVGGLVGYHVQGLIESSHTRGEVVSTGKEADGVGGLVGWSTGEIRFSYSESTVTASGQNAQNIGGLVGHNDFGSGVHGIIQSSYATGLVTGGTTVGGLVGYNNGEIRTSYATGDVVTLSRGFLGRSGYAGGFVGFNQRYGLSHNGGPTTYYGGHIQNAYSTGQVNAPNLNDTTKGSFIGENAHRIDYSYSRAISGLSFSGTGGTNGMGDIRFSRPVDDADLTQEATFEGWDFDQTWVIEPHAEPPQLRKFQSPTAELHGLEIRPGALDTVFDPQQLSYTATVPFGTTEMELLPGRPLFTELVAKQDGVHLSGNENSYRIVLEQAETILTIETRSPNGEQRLTYTIVVERDSTEPTYTVGFDVNGGSLVADQSVPWNASAVMPQDPAREGYTFGGWYAERTFETRFDFATPILSDTTVYAKWLKETALTLTIASEHGQVEGARASYTYGDTVALNATPAAGYRFEGWVDGVTGKALAIQSVYTFTITGHTQLVARFIKEEPDLFVVRFVNASGHQLLVQHVRHGEAAMPPPNPAKPNAEFIGWSGDYSRVQSDLTLRPVYSERAVTYHVTVVGGSILSGVSEYAFDSQVTVEADLPVDGQLFSHWEREGSTVSYNDRFTFHITGDTILTAVYTEQPVSRIPLAAISPDVKASPETGRLSFIGQIDLPAAFALVECGLVVKRSDTILTELDLSTTGVVRARSSTQTSTGQFMMNKTGVASGETWYAAAYLIYRDSEGQIMTVYSEVTSGTMP